MIPATLLTGINSAGIGKRLTRSAKGIKFRKNVAITCESARPTSSAFDSTFVLKSVLPTIDSVIQEGDLLHLVMREENAAGAYHVIDEGPED